jgi:hypothetical protein
VSTRTLSYRLHKPTGQALITLNGKDHYLGKHGTEKSRDECDRLIALWLVNGWRLPPARSTDEVDNIRLALRWPKRLYSHTATTDFDSLALEALRGEMIRAQLCRKAGEIVARLG